MSSKNLLLGYIVNKVLLPAEIKLETETILREKMGDDTPIVHIEAVGGGSINNAFKIFTDKGIWFLKWNYKEKFPGMFTAEAKGLAMLSQSNSVAIPSVIGVKETGKYSFLILEYIEKDSGRGSFFELMGKGLADLHKNTSDRFGLDYDNYIGSLHQSNKKNAYWTDFLITERLEPQLKLARDKNLLDRQANKQFEKLFNVLHEVFPKENPALLHGDLWSGNYLVGKEGTPYFIDPAVYYGHREIDISMSKLFGGFNEEFYSVYNNEWPMEKGWEKRVDICNLYPLLVHTNLFGVGYVSQVLQIIRQF